MADTILPHALPSALDGRGPLKLLSLDCFDTLLWRDTHAPRDLFGALPNVTVPQRQWAELRARSASAVRRLQNEVHIAEIYAELLPNGTAEERAAAVQNELDAEASHCFAFAPAVELMREAHRRGMGVIIVSDTYLDADQLRGLIAASAGEEVAGMIHRIFCSSFYGRSKGEGLYELVLKELNVAPRDILHIGDNKKADVEGVAPFGVNTLHLKQFDDMAEQRLRLEAAVSAMLDPTPAEIATTHQPHRASLSAIEPRITDPAERFGFSTLGPVLGGFERWLAAEARALQAERGGNVHYLFLMRDGHLPMLVHQATGAHVSAHAIEISRFTATAASLTSEAAIERYLQLEIMGDLKALANQLLLPKTEVATILRELPATGRPAAFLRAIRNPARMRRIIKNAEGFAERMIAHIRASVNPAKGDTLMLVDLGYNGSVQNDIDRQLSEALNVHVAGRYLLLREQSLTGFDKSGFLGPEHYDAYTLESLCSNVAVLEQLCTAAQGSVVDYSREGEPIRRGNSIKSRQSAIRDRVQQGCIRFVREERSVFVRHAVPDEATMWRRGAAAVLGRLMFIPMPQELAVLAEFEHDVNLGVDDTVALFDADIAKRGLRQRGLFYMKGSERMYLPAELHGEGLSLKLALLASKRFGLALKYADFIDQSISLPVIIADGRNVSTGNVTATPTHDGYYLAPIPIGDCRFSIGIQFGRLYEWLQVDSAVFMPVKRFLSDKQRPGLDEVEARPSLEGMEQTAPHLFRCADEGAFMMVPPPQRQHDEPMMLAVVFRPIAPRETVQAPAAARFTETMGANS
ncbi:HAD family hydrolase [Sphingomonas sp. JC676]|uniref:HAD family hydrolase n=1 Tax=Sphingomonas sp. JC676 TaxID=2768065 RepID=UPI001657ACEA|nr:HAD family hydrolase [Sphingomonas sp. JC676]MBC9032527.1 HAD family hydrolase [Sphingomonas sp. JC676]